MNERDEEILGKALGRAVDAQIHRETPFERSRLAAALDRPARSPFFAVGRLAFAAAALVLAVGAGVYLAQLRGNLPPASSPTPTGSAPVVVPSPTPSGTPLPGHAFVYCARDFAPPFAVTAPGAGVGATADERIASRLRSLEQLQPLQGLCPTGFPSAARVGTVSVQGDLATVDYTVAGDDWQHLATSVSDGLVQQIVYTATEEPGIRRVRVTQNGGQVAHVSAAKSNGVRLTTPLAREDVLGYATKFASELRSQEERRPATAETRSSVDAVAAGLARFVIELTPKTQTAERFWIPEFNATLRSRDETQDPSSRFSGKWILQIDVPGVEQRPANRVTQIDRTPLRWIEETATTGPDGGMRYALYLDDARPWRIGWAIDPVRLIVDVGGPTPGVSMSNALYSPAPGATVDRTFTVTGMARAFEANVVWRITDVVTAQVYAEGNTTASIGSSPTWGVFETQIRVPDAVRSGSGVMLWILQASARDGSDVDPVKIPITVR